MRKYEAMCVFRANDDAFTRGKDAVRNELKKLDANIIKEEDMGQRTLAYPIQNETQGHYFYFVAEMDPEKAHQTPKSVELLEELLRFMVVRQES